MTFSEFSKLSLDEKVYKVFEHGHEIMSRQFLYFDIKLYSFFDFYVELWYLPSINKIDRVDTLNLDEVLQLYKHEFDISGLFE
ncbi:MAG: hypothetical protein KGZ97_09030 [Bacteroidetes bacterium]|nr:hypothetical protein [Bacteroidota bacterium]